MTHFMNYCLYHFYKGSKNKARDIPINLTDLKDSLINNPPFKSLNPRAAETGGQPLGAGSRFFIGTEPGRRGKLFRALTGRKQAPKN
jgi:hypothetical protein